MSERRVSIREALIRQMRCDRQVWADELAELALRRTELRKRLRKIDAAIALQTTSEKVRYFRTIERCAR